MGGWAHHSVLLASARLERYLGPTVVPSGAAMRWKATIATVDNRSRAVLGEGGEGAEGRPGIDAAGAGTEGAGFTAGLGRTGGASLSFTRLSGLGAGLDAGLGGVAASAVGIGATEGAGAAVRVRSGAEVLIGMATAEVGMGARRAASGLEWYPNQKTVAGAGVAGGRLGGYTLFAGGYANEGTNAGVGAGAEAFRSRKRTRCSNRYFSALESAFHRLVVGKR